MEKLDLKLGEKIKELNFNSQEKHLEAVLSHAEKYSNELMAHGTVPIFNLNTCICGCNKIGIFINEEVFSKQDQIKYFTKYIEKLKKDLSTLN